MSTTAPYLDYLSTSWVLSEYRRADDVYHEHLRIIDNLNEAVEDRDRRIRGLERELAEVKAKYQALHRKQFKPSRKNVGSGHEIGSAKAGNRKNAGRR